MPDLLRSSTLIIAGGGVVAIPIGLAVALVLTLLFVGSSSGKKGERARRKGLALTSVIAGPLVGALLASIKVARGEVIPIDVVETYAQCAGMGLLVGGMVGLAFLMTAALTPGDPGKPESESEI